MFAALVAASLPGGWVSTQSPPAPAYFMRSLQNPAEREESRPDVLDTPVLAGSVMKIVTLVAAIENGVIGPETARMCRRTTTADGRQYVCSHPDLKRPLSASEALAHSCNDFFVSLAPRLSRAMVNSVRGRLGLPLLTDNTNLPASLVGLDGPRITPRALLDVVARLVGADPQRPVAISDPARRVLIEGLRGSAHYGSAQALNLRKRSVLAKTGTAPMPGGSWMGLVVALEPADQPTRGIVVVAPGAAGLDAAAIAADLLERKPRAIELPVGANNQAVSTIRVGLTSGGNAKATPRELDLEEYIARVVAAEGEQGAPDAAQQALAITARTFALANRQRHRREGYDLCDTTHCQVLRPATVASRRAAAATTGRVLLYQGQPATVFYSASCGGYSELASAVWPGAVDHAAASQRDDACANEPPWVSSIRVDEIERVLRAAGHRGDRLRDVRVIDRTPSRRVARLQIDGFTPREISGHDFRMAVGRTLGWQRLKSTAFELRRTSSGFDFTGRGFGHGVGLCVIGAGQRAQRGTSADEILAFYFPSLKVGLILGSPVPTAAPAPTGPRSPAAMPSAPADVLLGLPGSEETDRGVIVQLVRSARDAIIAKTAVQQPSTIRVTVHPTIEAFTRATGQPWWVSGASDGDRVDLLPITILRQRGQLERTIRHEVAHVLLDKALADRPLWVREGAATYFGDLGAQPPVDAEPAGRSACPDDAEFVRPLSAGAHRLAYARAEACFRRQLDRGTKWQDVGRR